MSNDLRRFAIVRKDLIIAIKLARNLDDLLAVIKRKYVELKGPQATPPPSTGTTINISTTQTSTQSPTQNTSVQSPHSGIGAYPPPPPPPPPPPRSDMEMHMPPPPPPERGKFDESTKTIKCQYCGYSYDNRADIMFCPNCGNSLE